MTRFWPAITNNFYPRLLRPGYRFTLGCHGAGRGGWMLRFLIAVGKPRILKLSFFQKICTLMLKVIFLACLSLINKSFHKDPIFM